MFIVVFIFLILQGFLIWAMQNRLEVLSVLFSKLKNQVDEGETVIIENFKTITQGLKRVENEVKEIKRGEPKIKQAIKAAKVARRRESE